MSYPFKKRRNVVMQSWGQVTRAGEALSREELARAMVRQGYIGKRAVRNKSNTGLQVALQASAKHV